MKNASVFLLILAMVFIISVIATTNTSERAITYFPPDETISFTETKNVLHYHNDTLFWKTSSTTNKSTYLRQDIAMLYRDGLFIGFMNKWKQRRKTIHFEKELSNIHSGNYESISYHYSESHKGDSIGSTASMNGAYLQLNCEKETCYVLNSGSPSHNQMNYNTQAKQHWDHLISYFEVDENLFTKIPLIDLFSYKDHPLPSFNQKETDDIINHLWEGLYSNYIVDLMETNEQQRAHYMPLVLFNENEIQVLYQMNDNKEQLIQSIP